MFKRFLLQAPEGDSGAGGIGGETGGTGTADGGSPGDGGTGGDPAGTPPGEYVGPEWAKDWKDVEAGLLNDPSLKAIQTPAALIKSYVHAQRNQGRDKVILPGKNSTKEEVDQFYQKLGVPLDEQKYLESVKFDKDKNYLGEDIGKEYAKQAHDLRIMPDKAVKLYEFIADKTKAQQDRAVQEHAAQTQSDLDGLRDKLGEDAYKVKLTKATSFLKENSTPEFLEMLGKSGLGKNAVLVDAFMKMADKFSKEESLPGGDENLTLTIGEMQGEINTMMGDFKGPYHNTSHPDHKRQVQHMLDLQTKVDKAKNRV